MSQTPADELTKAAQQLRMHHQDMTDVPWELAAPIASWLISCAGDIGTGESLRFCDEPNSVEEALRVARALTGGSE